MAAQPNILTHDRIPSRVFMKTLDEKSVKKVAKHLDIRKLMRNFAVLFEAANGLPVAKILKVKAIGGFWL